MHSKQELFLLSGVVKLIIFVAGLIGIGYGIVITFPWFIGDAANGHWFILLILLGGLWLIGWTVSLLKDFGGLFKELDKLVKEPILTEPATVLSKLYEKPVDGGVDTTYTYFIVFEFSDKSHKKFGIDFEHYVLIRENDTGILSYKQSNNKLLFIDFQLRS